MEQSLTRAMQTHVPGLVTITDNGVQARLAVTRLDEDGIGQAKTHRLLMPPDPFNVAILFQPYLAFVAAARETVNLSPLDEEHGEIGTFMDDFIQKVYLPQLEEKVTNLFQQAANSESPSFHVQPEEGLEISGILYCVPSRFERVLERCKLGSVESVPHRQRQSAHWLLVDAELMSTYHSPAHKQWLSLTVFVIC
jgi:hypothetical protein